MPVVIDIMVSTGTITKKDCVGGVMKLQVQVVPMMNLKWLKRVRFWVVTGVTDVW